MNHGTFNERVAALDSLEEACGSPSQYIGYLRGLALTYIPAATIQHHADMLHAGRRRMDEARARGREADARRAGERAP